MSHDEQQQASRHWDTQRVETFSDGVFAIAITLLVLDIHVPTGLHGLRHALGHEWPSYLAYATSFLTIGGVWITHHSIFAQLRYVDAPLMRINLLLLMTTAFLPFPTSILAEALRAPAEAAEIAVVLYGATALTIELLLLASARHVRDAEHLHDPARACAARAGRSRATLTVALYAVAIVIGLFDLATVATVCYLALAVYGTFALGDGSRARRRAAGARS